MLQKSILKFKNPNTPIWKILQEVPGLSDTTILKICAIFGISKNIRVSVLKRKQIRRLQVYITKNFLIGYKLARTMTTAVTQRFLSRSRRGIRSRRGLPINGQRTHSNAKTPRKLRGHWVLPEVLKNPREYFINRRNENYMPKIITQLLTDVQTKPHFVPKRLRRRWNKSKRALKFGKKFFKNKK